MDNLKKSNKMSAKNDLLMGCLTKFYNKKEHIEELLPIIKGQTKLSLRIIDWFLTNFSKKNTIWYDLEKTKPKTGDTYNEHFDVHTRYKQQLKAYSKKQFDPFCRRDRIQFSYNKDNYIITTVGQLNFFKWAIESKIIDFIEANYDNIEKDMNERNSISKRKKEDIETSNIVINNDNGKTRKKREELSVSACKCVKKENVKIIVSFN